MLKAYMIDIYSAVYYMTNGFMSLLSRTTYKEYSHTYCCWSFVTVQ